MHAIRNGTGGAIVTENTASGCAGCRPLVPSTDQALQDLAVATTLPSSESCTAEGESVACHKRAGTSPSVTAGVVSSFCRPSLIERNPPVSHQSVHLSRWSSALDTSLLAAPIASDGTFSHPQPSFVQRSAEMKDVGATSENTKEDYLDSPISIHRNVFRRSERNSAGSTRPSTTRVTLPPVAPSPNGRSSSSAPVQTFSPERVLFDTIQQAGGDALVSPSRKRGHSGNSELNSTRQPKASLATIADKISAAVRSGGLRYQPSTFKTWEQDLQLLKPDRASLTLGSLLTQQRTYTEALLCQGIVARIIHSWCLIAHERRLTTANRGKVVRRKQKEIRISLRTRKLGTLIVEIINQLSVQSDIGLNAYKICAALAGKYQHTSL